VPKGKASANGATNSLDLSDCDREPPGDSDYEQPRHGSDGSDFSYDDSLSGSGR
jgi:hypothetical protein